MGLIQDRDQTKPPKLFNSTLEVGLRILVILDALAPRLLDIQEISLYDYFIVHTGDVGGPKSLHPDIPSRPGEYIVRRRIIEEAIKLLQRIHLVIALSTESGIKFEVTDDANGLIDLMNSPYNQQLKMCADWLAEQACSLGSGQFDSRLRQTIDKWTLQFDAYSKNSA